MVVKKKINNSFKREYSTVFLGKVNLWLILALVLLCLLILNNLLLAYRYHNLKRFLSQEKNYQTKAEFNKKIADFGALFVDKVIKADREVDLETRLRLENSVRAINDKEILDAWIRLTKSKNENEAQKGVKELLKLLFIKIKI